MQDRHSSMQTSFGTLVAVAIIAAGFLLTGDLSWCVAKVSQALDRPSSAARAPGPQPPVPFTPAESASSADRGSGGSTPAEPATGPQPPVRNESRPPRPAAAAHAPPLTSLERIDLATVTTDRRVVMWTASGGGPQCHVLHLLDPASGAALLQRRDPAGNGPARRVVAVPDTKASGPPGSVLVRGGRIAVQPLGIAHGDGGAVESMGPILALELE